MISGSQVAVPFCSGHAFLVARCVPLSVCLSKSSGGKADPSGRLSAMQPAVAPKPAGRSGAKRTKERKRKKGEKSTDVTIKRSVADYIVKIVLEAGMGHELPEKLREGISTENTTAASSGVSRASSNADTAESSVPSCKSWTMVTSERWAEERKADPNYTPSLGDEVGEESEDDTKQLPRPPNAGVWRRIEKNSGLAGCPCDPDSRAMNRSRSPYMKDENGEVIYLGQDEDTVHCVPCKMTVPL